MSERSLEREIFGSYAQVVAEGGEQNQGYRNLEVFSTSKFFIECLMGKT